jgi:hypothetical protein
MRKKDESAPVEVFAGTQWEATIVKSLLENAEIQAFVKDGTMGTLNPWHSSPGGINPVKVLVSGLDREKATAVVSDYLQNIQKK